MDKFYDNAYKWLISFGPRLLLSIVILIAGIWLIRKLTKGINNLLTKRRVDPSLRPFLSGTVSLALQVLLVFAIMQILGIQLTVFAALIGAVGVAGGLALSGTLQNFASGVLILLMKPFRVGDNIIAQELEGTVTTIRIFYTVVTTFDNRTVIIPNGKLSNEVIINLSKEGKRRLDIELKFGFSIPFKAVKAIIEKVINDSKGLLKEPTSRIGVNKIDVDGYIIMVNVWINAHGYQDVKMLLQQNIIDNLVGEGIKLPALK
jgi:small conductance mechanosensitive channel